MKIISSTQLKELDKYTIAKEPVASIDLMERAAEELTRAITHRWDTSFHIVVFAGPGNNGGDALAVARMLSKQNYHVEVFLFNTKGKLSEECQTNLERLKECGSVYFTEVSTQFDPPVLTERHLVVDGLFGSGLNKPLNGGFAAVVKYINASKAQVVAIDVPSGLMCEDNTYNIRQNMIRADVTLSIQLPKLSFLFPENEDIVGEWQLLDIQLKKDFIDTAQSPYYITEEEEIRSFAEPVDTDRYQAIAIGPGLGQEEDTALAMMEQIQGCPVPLVLDADAINIFGTHRNWLSRMPKRCILTPHLKELERLIGKCMDTYERLTKTKELAAYLQSYIIIKGSWSTVVTPEGNCYFNPTGNPGMATAGSGDVLTGILAALLAQGYTQEDACRLGVYVHGLAGDIAAEEKGEIGTTSSDLIDALPAAWKKLTETKGRFTKE